eukprot:9434657-Pyramimonas_sp.AAC.1
MRTGGSSLSGTIAKHRPAAELQFAIYQRHVDDADGVLTCKRHLRATSRATPVPIFPLLFPRRRQQNSTQLGPTSGDQTQVYGEGELRMHARLDVGSAT